MESLEIQLEEFGAYGPNDLCACEVCGYKSIGEMLYVGSNQVIYCGSCLAEELLSGHDVLDYDG